MYGHSLAQVVVRQSEAVCNACLEAGIMTKVCVGG